MTSFTGYTHGVNLGGWLSQTDDMTKAHYDTFITEKDIAYIAELGLDHVRVPVDYMVFENEDGSEIEDGYSYIDKCIAWCRQCNLHMILDIPKTYGYSFDPLDDTDTKAFFYDKTTQARFFSMWKRLAIRYGKYSEMLAFELLNEIVEPEVAEAWNGIALQAIDVIREITKDTWIIFGGTMYNSVASVPLMAIPKQDKVVFTFHSYEPLIFTHQVAYWVKNMPRDFRVHYPASIEEYRACSRELSQALVGGIFEEGLDRMGPEFFEKMFAPAIEYAESHGISLYCGEYGVIDLADDESKIRWAEDICKVFDAHKIGRAYWNYKEKDFGIVNIKDENVCKKLASLL